MHRIIRILLLPIIVILPLAFGLVNCARETSPTGGIADSIPPEFVSVKPQNSKVGIRPQKIVIEFDERITLDKVSENVMISPPLEKIPTFSAKKKKVIIDLGQQKLQDNVTYTFNFSNAIKDVNEGNVLEQYSYAFSTGNEIDSLKVSGKITTVEGEELPKKVFVVLYSELNDTIFKTQEPKYITRVKKDGSFLFNNIAYGEYNIFALADQNNDFIFNQENEKIGFYNSTIIPEYSQTFDTIKVASVFAKQDTLVDKKVKLDSFYIKKQANFLPNNVEIVLFANKQTNQYIRSKERLTPCVYSIGFAQPLAENDFSIQIPGFSENMFNVELLPTRDSILVWLKDTSILFADEVPLLLQYNKNGEQQIDTILLNSLDVPLARLQANVKDLPKQFFVGDSIVVEFTRPLAKGASFDLYKTQDTLALFSSLKQPYILNDKTPIITEQHYPELTPFAPKNFYISQELISKKLGQQRFALYFAKPISVNDVTIRLKAQPNAKFYEAEYDIESNSILCWITDFEIMKYKNPILEITYKRAGKMFTETVSFSTIFLENDMYRNVRLARLVAAINPKQENSLFLDNTLELVFNNSIKLINDSLFTLIEVTDSLQQNIITKIEKNAESPRRLEIFHLCEANKSYQLVIEKGAVQGKFGNWNKKMVFNINTQKLQKEKMYTPVKANSTLLNTRNIIVNTTLEQGSHYTLKAEPNHISDVYGDKVMPVEIDFICPAGEKFGGLELVLDSVLVPMVFELRLQTLKKNEQGIIHTIQENGVVRFENLTPGKYDLIYVYDDNANGKWDTGYLETLTLPEQKGTYPKTITIKPNWENKVVWAVPEK